MRTIWATVLLAVVSVAPRRADACSAPSCWPSFAVPKNGATVPANLPAFWWMPGSTQGVTADAGALTLVNVDGGANVPFTYVSDGGTHLVVPAMLEPGEQYEFNDGFACGGGFGGVSARVTVSPAAPLPTSLGTLQVDGQLIGTLTVMTRGGSCSEAITAAQRKALLQASVEAQPWLDVFFFEMVVDGVTWAPSSSLVASPNYGGSWKGRGEDLFYRRCSAATSMWAESGLSEGTHQAVLRAWVPGTDVVLSTPPVSFVMSCDAEAGTAENTDGGADAGSTDGADGGLDALSHSEGDAVPRCGCSSGAGAFAMLVLLALRRRR